MSNETQNYNAVAKTIPWPTMKVNAMRDQLKSVLPANMNIDFYCQSLAATLAIQQEKYKECNPLKLNYAMQRCAETGLLPDGKKATINPYKDDAKLIIMVGGFIDLLDAAGYRVQVENVYSGDSFKYTAGDNAGIHHNIDPFEDRGTYKGTYCILRQKSDNYVVVRELVSAKEMEKIKASAKTQNVWDGWADEKRKAAAIKRAAKRVSLNVQIEKAIEIDNSDYDLGKEKNITPSSVASTEPTSLLKELGLKKATEVEVPAETKAETEDDVFGK